MTVAVLSVSPYPGIILMPAEMMNSSTAGGIAAPAVGKKLACSSPNVFFRSAITVRSMNAYLMRSVVGGISPRSR